MSPIDLGNWVGDVGQVCHDPCSACGHPGKVKDKSPWVVVLRQASRALIATTDLAEEGVYIPMHLGRVGSKGFLRSEAFAALVARALGHDVRRKLRC